LEIPRAAIRKSVFTRQRTAQEGDAAAAQKTWPICLDGLADQQAWPSSLAAATHTPEREVQMEIATKNETEIDKQT